MTGTCRAFAFNIRKHTVNAGLFQLIQPSQIGVSGDIFFNLFLAVLQIRRCATYRIDVALF